MTNPTLNEEALRSLILSVAHEVLGKKPATARGSDPDRIDRLVVSAFRRAGYRTVTPRVDTKTFNKWIEEGRRPKEGERSVKVKQFRLFHVSQTRELTAEEKAGLAEKQTSDRSPKPKAQAARTIASKLQAEKAINQAAKAPANVTPLKAGKGKGNQPSLPHS
jgi:hypothetical protein